MSTTSLNDHSGPLRAMFVDGRASAIDGLSLVSHEHRTCGRSVRVTCPASWSSGASAAAAQLLAPDAATEVHVPKVLARIATQIAEWGDEDENSYFSSDAELAAFREDLTYALVHQLAMLDGPLLTEMAADRRPAASAALVPVADDLEALLGWNHEQTSLLVAGTRVSADLSNIRGSMEPLSRGGEGSGPVTFMRGPGTWSEAFPPPDWQEQPLRQVTLGVNHPDVKGFLAVPRDERAQALALESAGLSVPEQRANPARHAVALPPEFMEAAAHDESWTLRRRLDGEAVTTVPAEDLLRDIVEDQLESGDPVALFMGELERWATSPRGRAPMASTCGALVHRGEVAAPFAWVRAGAFVKDGVLDVVRFAHTVHVLTTALDIVVEKMRLPSESMAFASRRSRPLVIGIADLGGLPARYGASAAASRGLALARGVVAFVTGHAYLRSAVLAAKRSSRASWQDDRDVHLDVVRRHRAAATETSLAECPDPLLVRTIRELWEHVERECERSGIRNSHLTGLPRSAAAFALLGIAADSEAGAAGAAEAELRFQAAVQPLLSGGIDAVVPLAENATAQAVAEMMRDAWQFGLKRLCVAPPLSAPPRAAPRTGASTPTSSPQADPPNVPARPQPASADMPGAPSAPAVLDHAPRRRRMPRERRSVTHKFSIAGHEGYITAGTYEDGTLGEIFLTDFGKEGSTMRGMMNSFATAISIALQYGVPLEMLVSKFVMMRFDPEGPTENPEIPFARSMPDYIMRWLALRFLDVETRAALNLPELDATGLDS